MPTVPAKVRSVNFAIPDDAETVVVPPRVPPEPLAIDTVTEAELLVTVVLVAS